MVREEKDYAKNRTSEIREKLEYDWGESYRQIKVQNLKSAAHFKAVDKRK